VEEGVIGRRRLLEDGVRISEGDTLLYPSLSLSGDWVRDIEGME